MSQPTISIDVNHVYNGDEDTYFAVPSSMTLSVSPPSCIIEVDMTPIGVDKCGHIVDADDDVDPMTVDLGQVLCSMITDIQYDQTSSNIQVKYWGNDNWQNKISVTTCSNSSSGGS